MLYLLDKGLVRRCVEGLGNIADGIRLTSEQREAIAVLQLPTDNLLFVSDETWNLLMGLQIPRWIVYIITARVRRFVPRRYHSRWARRLRQQFGFEREDAHQLALATFGSDKQGTVLGGNWFVTFDRRLISRFYNQHSQIDAKLRRMTAQLRPPYSQAILPELAIPGEILSVS